MESASNLHHYLEDQLVGSSSSSLATTTSCYEVGSTSTHGWSTTPSILSTNHDLNLYSSETLLNPRQQVTNSSLLSSQYSSMSPDLSYQHWSNFNTSSDFLGQDSQQSRTKEEISDRCYLKYKDILTTTTSPSSSFDELSLKNHHQKSMQPDDVMGSKFLLKSFSSGNLLNKINHQLNSSVDHNLYSNFPTVANGGGRGSSQIFPSVNISNLNQMGLTNSSGSFEQMNLQALDLLTSSSSRFSGGFSPSSAQNHHIGMSLSDGFSYGFDHMQQSDHQLPLYGSSKVSAPSSKGVAEVKRNSSKMEPKAAQTSAPKKSRLEARASCPPFKVRKEKLGDRIAALQQLVAPFGKTDTASVLMEAIGYIKFLQSQVETLSVPYMKASRNNTSRAIKGGATGNENHEESKRDLKSRGLCLVPLSCLSYITECGGAAVWPPSHFGGAT